MTATSLLDSAPVVLITGASSGIGKATAVHLAGAGYRVFGTSRHPADDVPGVEMLELEITSNDSVVACVATLNSRTSGRIDVLVNNVGMGILGAAEESTVEQVQQLFDINFFGAVRMTNAVLPQMRQRKSGRLLFMTSAGGVASLPYAGYYCATKHALEAYAEALRIEVESFGVQAALIAPGTVSTSAGDKALHPDHALACYAPVRKTATDRYVRAIRNGMPTETVAAAIRRVLSLHRMQPRHTVGLQSWGVSLMKALLPARIFEMGPRRMRRRAEARAALQPDEKLDDDFLSR